MKYVDHYQEIKDLKPEGLRSHLRKYALDGLSILDRLKGIENELNKPRVQFLYIHHVFRDEEAKLDNLLKRLSINHAFLSYSCAVKMILDRRIDQPYICISSDDGFKNNVKAAEILNEYDAKACFFINPSIFGKRSYDEIERHCKDRLNFPPVEFMTWKEVEKIQKMGHEIGSHTMEHINVAATERDEFLEDCNSTFKIITENCGKAEHFAFPYGRFFHFNESARDIVFNAGFVSCATAERGCHIDHSSPLSYRELYIRRDHVILDWSLDHIFHFLAKNSRNATISNNLFKSANT